MIQLIGLVGKKQSGKSTSAEYLRRQHGFHELSFAKNLKAGAKAMFGLSEEQVNGPNEIREATIDEYGMSAREILQWLGTDVLRKRWPDFHVWGLDREIKSASFGDSLGGKPNKWVISDVRFENELTYIHKMGGISIRVIRKSQIEHTDTHRSETEQDNLVTEYTIECDDGIENVHKNIEKIMNLMNTLRGW